MSYLGLDIGTSGCKAVVFTEEGKQLAAAHRGYSVISPQPGWAELDSRNVVESCCAVIRETCGRTAGDPVKALAISSQGEAFTPVSKNGSYLESALVSSDCRAEGEIAPFVASFGLDRLYQITGHTPSTLFSLFKLLWLKRHRPDVWEGRPRFLCFEDLVQQRLGVEPAMGWPLAGRTMLFDVRNHCWSEEILQAIGLQASQLARPLCSGQIAGVIPPSVAAELGLPAGVKVVTGGHDQTIASLGAGVTRQGSAMYAAGTVECLCPITPQLTLTDNLCRHNLCSYDYSLPGYYTSIAYSLTGSNLLQYFKEQFAPEQPYEALLAQMPPQPTDLLALPYFTPSGTPYFDQKTPGSVLGWRLSTTRGQMLKGLLESVALEMKLNLSLLEESGIKIDRLIATGGGSRNRALVQLKADVLNRPIERMAIEEAGCLGAARLAQCADQGVSLSDLTNQHHGDTETVEPSPEKSARYERKFRQYRLFYSRIRELAAEIRSMA